MEKSYVREPLSDVRLYPEVAEFPDFRSKFGASREWSSSPSGFSQTAKYFFMGTKLWSCHRLIMKTLTTVHSLNFVHPGVPAQYPTFPRVVGISRFSFPIFNENREIRPLKMNEHLATVLEHTDFPKYATYTPFSINRQGIRMFVTIKK